jgi:bisphosphoglycerate-dependent phosphoglycerate mutase
MQALVDVGADVFRLSFSTASDISDTDVVELNIATGQPVD